MGSTPMYELQYLPLFYDDLLATVKYLSEVLHNPKAANKLIDDVENAILDRLPNAEAFEPFHSLKERRYPYYRIYVNNYIVYYVVIEHRIMEVRRLLYVGRNRDQIL
ncbi:MAG: type II toxin-antitoxin system RelE/ParE family toxin [Lachnospiraceae bacterium]|nr:type II toxin-antitoxin system RelE/ParE family toxin [Lachnospiraceae bacterium]